MNWLFRAWLWLGRLKDDGVMLYFAWKDPRTPKYLKGILTVMLMYVLSPIDILPDYLPLLGIADDVTILSAGILYVAQMLPDAVRTDCRRKSDKWRKRIPVILGLVILVGVAWIGLLLYGIGKLLFQ